MQKKPRKQQLFNHGIELIMLQYTNSLSQEILSRNLALKRSKLNTRWLVVWYNKQQNPLVCKTKNNSLAAITMPSKELSFSQYKEIADHTCTRHHTKTYKQRNLTSMTEELLVAGTTVYLLVSPTKMCS